MVAPGTLLLWQQQLQPDPWSTGPLIVVANMGLLYFVGYQHAGCITAAAIGFVDMDWVASGCKGSAERLFKMDFTLHCWILTKDAFR